MAFDNSDPGDGIGKPKTAAVGGKTEGPHNIETVISQRPVRVQRLQQRGRLISAQRLHATLTGFAPAIREIGRHGVLQMSKSPQH